VGEMLEEKFLEESSDGASAYADEDVIDRNLHVVFIAVGIVETGDPAGRELPRTLE